MTSTNLDGRLGRQHAERGSAPPAFRNCSGMDPRVALRLPEDDEKTTPIFRSRE
jgi:hypothetical protein